MSNASAAEGFAAATRGRPVSAEEGLAARAARLEVEFGMVGIESVSAGSVCRGVRPDTPRSRSSGR